MNGGAQSQTSSDLIQSESHSVKSKAAIDTFENKLIAYIVCYK